MSTAVSPPLAADIDREYTHIHVADYLKFRAALEKVDCDLGRDWFEVSLTAGVRTFFGIIVDDSGNVLNDMKNPKALREYMITI